MSSFPNLKKPSHFIATLGGVGNAKYAPGTWGSLVSLFLFILASHYFSNMAGLVIAMTFYSIWLCDKVSATLTKKDHPAIVIDELAGMWIAAYPAIHYTTQNERVFFVITAFILFRFFDILKPFPISYLDKNIRGGLGIVLDDVVAGLFTAATTIILMTLVFF